MNAKMNITAVTFCGIVAAMLLGSYVVSVNYKDFFITIGIISTAIAVGAIFGTALAPFDNKEEEKFGIYSKAIGLFVGGYIASKADKLIDRIFDPMTYANISQIDSFRLVAAIAVTLAVSKLTFAFRSYGYQFRQ